MDITAVKQAIINRVEFLTEIAKSKGLRYPKTTHDFTLRGRCAGQYVWSYSDSTLRWNLDIAKDNLNVYLSTTVPHELAHAIQRYHHPRSKSHGKEWKDCCKALVGHELLRCHKYKTTPARKVRRFKYSCDCMEHSVSTILHNRIVKGGRTYRCTKCKTPITISNLKN
jgi:SprT protein